VAQKLLGTVHRAGIGNGPAAAGNGNGKSADGGTFSLIPA